MTIAAVIFTVHFPWVKQLLTAHCDLCDNSIEMEDTSEAESRGKSSAPTSPLILDESKTAKIPEFPLTLLRTQPKCEVYPDVHKIIQVLYLVIIMTCYITLLFSSCMKLDHIIL